MYGVDGFEVLDVFAFGEDELVDELHALTILASFLVQQCQQIVFAHARSRLGRGGSGSRRPERHGRRRSRWRARRTRHLIVVLDRPEVGILSIKPPRRLSPHLRFVVVVLSQYLCGSVSFFFLLLLRLRSSWMCCVVASNQRKCVGLRDVAGTGREGYDCQYATRPPPGGCGGLWPRGCTSRGLFSLVSRFLTLFLVRRRRLARAS